jgi:hypothetical protein
VGGRIVRRTLEHLRRNLVAYIALFLALSSGGYAAATKLLPRNSVGTRQVINHSLQRVDLKRGTLPGLLVVTETSVEKQVGPASASGPVEVTALCPRGQVAIGGGWRFSDKPQEVILADVVASRRVAGGWLVKVAVFQGAGPPAPAPIHTFIVYAYCIRGAAAAASSS